MRAHLHRSPEFWLPGNSPPLKPIIDWQQPLAQGLIFDLPLNGSLRELVRGDRVTLLAGGSNEMSYRGPTLRANGIAGAGTIPLNLSTVKAMTVSFWFNSPTSANGDSLAFEHGITVGGGNPGFYYDPDESTGVSAFNFRTNLGNVIYSMTRPAVGWHHYAVDVDVTLTNTACSFLSLDGAPSATYAYSVGTTNAAAFFPDATLYLAHRDGGVGSPALFKDCNLEAFKIWNRALTRAEKFTVYSDRAAVYQQPRRRIFSGRLTTSAGGVSKRARGGLSGGFQEMGVLG